MIIRIFNKDVPLQSLLFVVGEGILIYVAVIVAAFLRLNTLHATTFSVEILSRALLVTLVCQGSLYYNELYDLKVTDTFLELGLRLTKAMGVASIVLALIYYLVPSLMMGRGVFFTSLVFLILLVVPWRYVYSWILRKKMFSEKVLVLGVGTLSSQIVDEIFNRPECGYEVAGLISLSTTSPLSLPKEIPHFKMDQTMCDLVDSLRATKIVVAMDEKRGMLPTDVLLRCKLKGITVLEGESLYEELTGKLFIEKLNPSWLIFSDGFRKSPVARFFKRITGLVMASLALVLTLPLFCLVAIAIKLDSKGSVFYKQDRVTEDGRIFKVLKFRSMIDNAEAISGPLWASDDDPRVTRIGAVIRKFRLDELPQLWNVLKGDMSFVGPRPERPEFVKKLMKQIPYYRERHTVKPGITGWAQVSYRYGASVDDALEKLKYDLFYAKNMSLALDILIMFKTIKIVLLGSGAR
jgi:sugar transferase (PEP-CTERM system associated)